MISTIIGGTGTLGTELTKQLLEKGHEIRIFSRGEHAQKEHKRKFNSPKISYIIGDVADDNPTELIDALGGADYCFLLAALKHVDVCQNNPYQAVKTNIIGAENTSFIAKQRNVKLIFTTTDKAIDPINVYGNTKAIAEQIIIRSGCDYKIFRWGNVIGSQGSVIQIWKDQLLSQKQVIINSLKATRFWITVEDVAIILAQATRYSWDGPYEDHFFIPSMKGASIYRIFNCLCKILDVKNARVKFSNLDYGEKDHERLQSIHPKSGHDGSIEYDSSQCDQYSDAELEELLRSVI